MPYDNDILVRIIIKKDNRKVSYLTQRLSATDIPILTCCASRFNGKWQIVLGARPKRVDFIKNSDEILSEIPTKEEIKLLLDRNSKEMKFESNMRGSKEYREILASVLVERGICEITGGNYED